MGTIMNKDLKIRKLFDKIKVNYPPLQYSKKHQKNMEKREDEMKQKEKKNK
jgi:hypothetical protein